MKRKGFTLIELLAVIVILAIIALIATPIVLDIIEDSKNSSIKRSAELYLDAVEQAIATSAMNDGLEDGTYIIDSKGNLKYKDKTIKVNIKNYNFESGTITIEQGQIKNIKLSNNEKVTTGKELNKIDKWDGKTIKEVTADSNGIYHITKASELAWVAQQVNSGEPFEGKTISLDTSLDLGGRYDKDGKKLGTEWIPIGTKKSADELFPFKGIFEGNNNIISGIYINKLLEDSNENKNLGLFGHTNSATISNLIIKDSYIQGYSSIGIICGSPENKSVIANILMSDITINALKSAGIGVGATDTQANLFDLYSYNSKIYGNGKYIGGVVGSLRSSGIGKNLYSNAVINNSSNEVCTGGIVGGIIEGSWADNLVSESTIKGNIGLGGIVGQFQGGSKLTNSVSYADVLGNDKVGGVIGVCSGYSGDNFLENIKSYAKINGNGEFVGGIIGVLSQGNNYLTNIYSKSKVKGKDKVGGIIGGFTINYATTLNYKSVISESTIEGETNKGELWGYIDSTSTINKMD